MSRHIAKFAALIVLLAAVPLLAGCHTVAGAGEDISKAGQAVKSTADKVAP